LKTIVSSISREHGHSLLLSANTSAFSTQICPPLELTGKRWAVGLLNLKTYNSIPNITEKNNVFTYSTDSGSTWKTITLAVGSYEIGEINSEIQRLMQLNGDSGIEITVNRPSLGSVVNITPATYAVDLTVANSLALTLGFDPVILTQGYNISPHIVKILTVNSVLVNCNIVGHSYLKSKQNPVLYSFFPNVKPGYKVVEAPVNVVYLPLNSEQIQDIRIWLTDQDGKFLDFRGETITCRLHFKQM